MTAEEENEIDKAVKGIIDNKFKGYLVNGNNRYIDSFLTENPEALPKVLEAYSQVLDKGEYDLSDFISFYTDHLLDILEKHPERQEEIFALYKKAMQSDKGLIESYERKSLYYSLARIADIIPEKSDDILKMLQPYMQIEANDYYGNNDNLEEIITKLLPREQVSAESLETFSKVFEQENVSILPYIDAICANKNAPANVLSMSFEALKEWEDVATAYGEILDMNDTITDYYALVKHPNFPEEMKKEAVERFSQRYEVDLTDITDPNPYSAAINNAKLYDKLYDDDLRDKIFGDICNSMEKCNLEQRLEFLENIPTTSRIFRKFSKEMIDKHPDTIDCILKILEKQIEKKEFSEDNYSILSKIVRKCPEKVDCVLEILEKPAEKKEEFPYDANFLLYDILSMSPEKKDRIEKIAQTRPELSLVFSHKVFVKPKMMEMLEEANTAVKSNDKNALTKFKARLAKMSEEEIFQIDHAAMEYLVNNFTQENFDKVNNLRGFWGLKAVISEESLTEKNLRDIKRMEFSYSVSITEKDNEHYGHTYSEAYRNFVPDYNKGYKPRNMPKS